MGAGKEGEGGEGESDERGDGEGRGDGEVGGGASGVYETPAAEEDERKEAERAVDGVEEVRKMKAVWQQIYTEAEREGG